MSLYQSFLSIVIMHQWIVYHHLFQSHHLTNVFAISLADFPNSARIHRGLKEKQFPRFIGFLCLVMVAGSAQKEYCISIGKRILGALRYGTCVTWYSFVTRCTDLWIQIHTHSHSSFCILTFCSYGAMTFCLFYLVDVVLSQQKKPATRTIYFLNFLKFTKIKDTCQSLESILLLVEMVALGAKLVDPAGFNLHVI